jgi:hypothetical protein
MMADGRQKPGFMLYFDCIRPALNRLDDTQCGQLFRAVLNYAEFGELSDLDPLVGMAFDLIRPRIDRDSERYRESRDQRRHAVYVREARKRGEDPLSLSEWRGHRELSSDNGPISPDIENIGPYPSTSSSPSLSPTRATSSSPSPAASTAASSPGTEITADKDRGAGEGETTFKAFSPLSEDVFERERERLLRVLCE